MYEFITMFGLRVLGAAAAKLEDAMLNDPCLKTKRVRMIWQKNQILNSSPSSWGKAKRLRAYGLTNTSTLRLLAANPAVGPARHRAATL